MRERSALQPVRSLLGRRFKILVSLSGASLLGGLAEALFLVVVTRIGFAITSGEDTVEILPGSAWSKGAGIAFAFGLIIARVALAIVAGRLSSAQTTGTIADVRQRLTRAYLGARWEIQQSSGVGQLQELLTTFTNQTTQLLNALTNATVAAFNLVALLGLSVAVNPLVSFGVIIVVGLLGSALRPVRNSIRRGSLRSAAIGSSFAGSLSEVSDLGMEFHVFHVQDRAADRVGSLIAHHEESERRLLFTRTLVPTLYAGLAFLAVLIALAVVSATDSSDLVSIGAIMLVMLRSLSYGQGLQSALAQWSTSLPYLERLNEKLESFEAGARVDGGRDLPAIGTIEFRRVCFEYTPGVKALNDLSFTIGNNEVIGVVGPSGGGKSTLVQVMLGLRDVSAGEVLIDGVNLREFDREQLARRMTFVPQDAHLFNGTVAENIRFMRDDISDADVEAAARDANLWADIEQFEGGLDRQVGDRGGHLSGGQRQRLCIARALVERPDVLILDEPTSALDVKSEQLIRETLVSLSRSMTIVIIAHRISTLDVCDRIMVIQRGQMSAFDTPAALESDSDFYREALTISGMR